MVKTKKQKKYGWKKGRRQNVKAEVAGKELERIRAERLAITPDILIEEAADPTNPLHPVFDWDDTIAARKYRLVQARQLLNSLEIYVMPQEGGKEQEPTIAYVHIGGTEQGYQRIVDVLNDDDMYNEALLDATRFLVGVQKRFSHLEELKPVWEALSKVQKRTLRRIA